MKIRKGVLFSFLLVAGLSFVGFSPQSYAAKQKKDIVFNTFGNCTGTVIGSVVLKKRGSDVLVKVKITNGIPNEACGVFWVCSNGGCRDGNGNCSLRLGETTMNGSGKGKFKWKGSIPFEGRVYFDISGTAGVYYSGVFDAP